MTTTPEVTEAPETKSRLQYINSDLILPSPHQTRIFPEGWEEEESTREMVQSIRKDGLFQPPLVRRAPLSQYYLIAGERRLRCSRLAGLTEIPVIIKEVTEKEAAKITAAENYNREDLTIIEEAAAIKVLIEAYDGDVAEVGAYIDKSEAWVRGWARIADIEECWKALMLPDSKQEDDLWKWKVGHWRLIARLDKKIQHELYQEYKKTWHGHHFCGSMTVKELNSFLEKSFCKLSCALWELETFKGQATKGKTCAECYLRSDRQKGLFDSETEKAKDARCLSENCFYQKTVDYLLERYNAEFEGHGKRLQVGTVDGYSKMVRLFKDTTGLDAVDCNYRYKRAAKKHPQAVPVLMLSGSDAGKIMWKKDSYNSSTTSAKPETEEEKEELRQERLKKKRELLVVKFMLSQFTELERHGKEYQLPKNVTYPDEAGELQGLSLLQRLSLLKLAALLTIIGGDPLRKDGEDGFSSEDDKGRWIAEVQDYTIAPEAETDHDLYEDTLERLDTMCCHTIRETLMQIIRNKYYIPHTYLKALCSFYGLDYKVLTKASLEAFPDKKPRA